MRNKNFEKFFFRLQYIILVLLAVCLYLSSSGHPVSYIIIAATALYIILFEIFLYLHNRNLKITSENILSFLDITARKRLTEFPIPVIISDNNGEIIWFSELFADCIGEDVAVTLKSVQAIDERLPDHRNLANVLFGGRSFSIYTDKSDMNGREMYIYYLFDTTDYNNLIHEHEMSAPVVSYLLIDNYDELFSMASEGEKNHAMAQIDEAVSAWLSDVKGILRKIERDRYMLICENRDFLRMAKNQFAILDRVKHLKVSEKTFPTFSIGMGMGGGSFEQNEAFARKALDMALSRGGDQAVVRNLSDYEFFGGSTKNGEGRTKVKARVVASAFNEILKNTETVYIMGHRFSDFDSIGSCMGIYRIAKSAGKNAFIIMDDDTSLGKSLLDQIRQIPDYDGVFLSPANIKVAQPAHSLLVITDTHRKSMLPAPELIEKVKNTVVIDHHRKSPDYIRDTALFFHDSNASSSCEMTAELVQYMADGTLSKIEADSLLAGIVLDTKSYSIRTTALTFETSSYLRKAGASTINVKRLFQTDKEIYRDKTALVTGASVYRDVTAIARCSASSDNIKIAASQAADDLLNMEGILASFTLFRNKDGTLNISARSFGSINVQIIMEWLGGGGHQTMAGAQFEKETEESVMEKLKEAIDRYLREVNVKTR